MLRIAFIDKMNFTFCLNKTVIKLYEIYNRVLKMKSLIKLIIQQLLVQ